MSKKYTAQRACGACKFEFENDPSFIANCHCADCKKASGGVMATFFGVTADDFTLTSGAPKAFHYTSDTNKGLDRNFCPECGARLYVHVAEAHHRELPEIVRARSREVDDPDQRVLAMLGARVDVTEVRGSGVAVSATSSSESSTKSAA